MIKPPDARTVVPGHPVTYHGVPAPTMSTRSADILAAKERVRAVLESFVDLENNALYRRDPDAWLDRLARAATGGDR